MNAVLNNRIFTAPMLWTAGEAEAVTRGISTQSWVASGVTIDAQKVSPGDLFIHVNEDDFEALAIAFKRGASAAVVSAVPVKLQRRIPFLIVEDTFRALLDLAAVGRLKAEPMQSIAIAGSVGKSSIKAILSTALNRQGLVQSSQKAGLSPHLSIPLALANTHPKTDYALYEIGAERYSEMYAFSRQIKPNVAIISNVTTPNHDHFDDLDDVASEYANLFESMDATGTVILNADCPFYPTLMAEARTKGVRRVWGFGGSRHAHARLIDIHPNAGGQKVICEILGERYIIQLPLMGRHMVDNLLASLLAVVATDACLERALINIEKMQPLTGRGRKHELTLHMGRKPVNVIDETAHMCPVSLENAIVRLAKHDEKGQGRRVLVMGDMTRFDSFEIYNDMMDTARQLEIDTIITVGMNEAFADADYQFENADELNARLTDILKPGDVVMLKSGKDTSLQSTLKTLHSLHYANETSDKKNKAVMNDMPVMMWSLAATANDG